MADAIAQRVQPTRAQVRAVKAHIKAHLAKEWPAYGTKHLAEHRKEVYERFVRDALVDLDKKLNPPPPKVKERVNGFAAGAALLEIYERRWGEENRDWSSDIIPIAEFVEKLTSTDKRALPGFWTVLHDFLAIVSDGCVPHSYNYIAQFNLTRDDTWKVMDQLGYSPDVLKPKKGAKRG